MSDLTQIPAMQYMVGSRLSRAEVSSFKRPDLLSSPPYKNYPEAARYTLPTDWKKDLPSFQKILQGRRSKRHYAQESLSLRELSFLLWASQGVTGAAGKHLFRAAPSAGALYPVETYISVNTIEELSPGLYHFDPRHFELELLSNEAHSETLSIAALNQQFVHQAGVNFIWTAMFRRNLSKYGNRGLRYIMMDAGHICQNLLLAAEALGLQSCPVAAFFDDEVNEILAIDGEEESAIYMASVGR